MVATTLRSCDNETNAPLHASWWVNIELVSYWCTVTNRTFKLRSGRDTGVAKVARVYQEYSVVNQVLEIDYYK